MVAERHEGGGILGFFKRLFRRKETHPKHKQGELPLDAPKTDTQQTEKKVKDFSQQVIEELKRVSPSHPARQLLQGAMFSEECIRRNEDLGRLLLDVIHQPDTASDGSSIYHSQQWLTQILQRFHEFDQRLEGNADGQIISGIEENLETLLKSTQAGDIRIAEQEEQIKQIKSGQAPQTASTWQEALHNIPTATDEGQRVHEIAKRIESGGEGDPRNFGAVATTLEEAMKDLSQTVNQNNPQDLKRYQEELERYKDAYGKLGKYYIEKHHEGGRLWNVVNAQWGGSWELMEKALHENPEYMNYWFYHILEPILHNERLESHRELYSLYVAGDMEIFMSLVSRMRGPNGENIGRNKVGYYTMLKNTIFQSHDMDYYAAHPSLDMKEFITSTALFTNNFIDYALQDPLVALSKRMYETALLQLRENHNGYVPREYLVWTQGRMGIGLDRLVEGLVKQAIENGQLYHTKVDPATGQPLTSRWNRIQIDKDRPFSLDDLYGGEPAQSTGWKKQLGDLRLAAALKQAKGLFLVDMRMLEIIGRSKGTGNYMEPTEMGNYSFKGPGFNSVPYEGIVRHIEPMIHYFTRYYIGGDVFHPFFNMMITGKHDWNPDDMRRLLELYFEGDHETMRKEFGNEIDTRLTAADNPFAFSGMWGTFTKWRTGDTTKDFDDWELEQALSTANRLSIIGDKLIRKKGVKGMEQEEGSTWQATDMSDEAKTLKFYQEEENHLEGKDGLTAKEFYESLREEYRQSLLASGDLELISIAQYENNLEFEKNWRKIGIKQTNKERGKSYEDLLKEHLKGVKERNGKKHVEEEMEERQQKLERAYKARIWIQAAMRSPLLVARELKFPYEVAGFKRSGPFRKKIIYDILGIDIDEVGQARTPLKREEEIMQPIYDLEGAVASISQISLRENRDLQESDFDKIKDPALRENAKKYWAMVKKAMLGSHTAEQWYKKIGIENADLSKPLGLRFHRINWNQIDKISLEHVGESDHSIFKNDEGFCIGTSTTGASDLMDTKLVDRDWRYLFSTEDMGWEYLNIAAAGERNPVRRAGDLGSHVEFNQLFEQLLTTQVKGRIDIEKTLELMQKMLTAMSGDFLDIGYEACGRVLYTVGQMYRKADWAWKYPGVGQLANLFKDASIMQMIYGREHADALGPNEMYKLVHGAEELKILPAHKINKLTKQPATFSEWNIDTLEERLGCTKTNMVYEIMTMVVLISIALTLWRAFTAEDEESKGGSGGSGHS